MSEIKVRFVNLGLQYESMRDEIVKKIDEISFDGMYVFGDELIKFENSAAKFCETKYALGVANATDALFLCLKAKGIGPGDEVITVPNSFIATGAVIANVGAKIVFVDNAEDYNINVNLIEAAITNKTKAIIPVHLTGRPAEMDKINEIAKKHNLFVIEDAAQAIGAKYKGKRVGSLGDVACFSLHPLKNLHVQGDGGLITTNDEELYNKLKGLRNHGLINRDECEFWGFNSRLDAIQAAIANLKLLKIDEWNDRFRDIADMYRRGLKSVVTVPTDKEYEESVYHNFVIQTDKRDELQAFLLENGIETKIHYPIPIHLQKPARKMGYKEGDFPMCETQVNKILSLPIYPELTNQQVELVIKKINEFFKE